MQYLKIYNFFAIKEINEETLTKFNGMWKTLNFCFVKCNFNTITKNNHLFSFNSCAIKYTKIYSLGYKGWEKDANFFE